LKESERLKLKTRKSYCISTGKMKWGHKKQYLETLLEKCRMSSGSMMASWEMDRSEEKHTDALCARMEE